MFNHANGANDEMQSRIDKLAGTLQEFRLSSLESTLEACQHLADSESLLDVAVLGQFKSGKSTLLNTLIGESIFPVSVLPATAVITRAQAGDNAYGIIHFQDGHQETIAVQDIKEYVTESGNPQNIRHVAVMDVITPKMLGWAGIRLVDMPGLESLYSHNTEATRTWLPHVAVALVAVSVE
ncbi:MAG TPA: dynamin family protein [Gemmatales bacterium]|nr:dynamin family protein [Gemmatales bacterium]